MAIEINYGTGRRKTSAARGYFEPRNGGTGAAQRLTAVSSALPVVRRENRLSRINAATPHTMAASALGAEAKPALKTTSATNP